MCSPLCILLCSARGAERREFPLELADFRRSQLFRRSALRSCHFNASRERSDADANADALRAAADVALAHSARHAYCVLRFTCVVFCTGCFVCAASCSADMSIKLWDFSSYECIRTLVGVSARPPASCLQLRLEPTA